MSLSAKSKGLTIVLASSFTVGIVALLCRRKRQPTIKKISSSLSEAARLCELFSRSRLWHPWLSCRHFHSHDTVDVSSKENDRVANFTDLAEALATLCGVNLNQHDNNHIREEILKEMGGSKRRHLVFCLCDGMGNSILDKHLPKDSFLFQHRNKHIQSLRAVFPSTTPAALTTLATATWPGRHGMPGWDLREFTDCDYPGQANGELLQLRVLATRITDTRAQNPIDESFSFDHVFVQKPWARTIREKQQHDEARKGRDGATATRYRRMTYINAYNGDGLRYQSNTTSNKSPATVEKTTSATDFSSWQTGQDTKTNNRDNGKHDVSTTPDTLFDTATIGETVYETLGQPEGASAAIQYFRDGIDAALRVIATAEANSNEQEQPTFTYVYTAHPDKHMHALGTNHLQVQTVVRGINKELERMWDVLGDREELLSKYHVPEDKKEARNTRVVPANTNQDTDHNDGRRVDAALVVSADHGHVTVEPNEMVVLPQSIVDCLEYANIGIFGPGRHAYLHCRAGLQSRVQELWNETNKLRESFVLLTIEEAAMDMKLFGPLPPLQEVRPRMGDLVAISIDNHTLVSPREADQYKHCCRGAHGSLLPEEMSVPFVTCVPPSFGAD